MTPRRPTPPAAGAERFGRSVVFVGGGIGDVLMRVGLFKAIAAASRGGRVSVACKKSVALGELFAGCDFVDAVIGLSDDEAVGGMSAFKAADKLRPYRFDTLWGLSPSTTVVIAALLAGIPNRLGYVRRPGLKTALLTRRVAAAEGAAHPADLASAHRLATHLGLDPQTASARFAPLPQCDDQAARLLDGRPAIAIGLNCSEPERQWGERYVELAARLGRACPHTLLLYGGADVTELARRVRAQAGLPEERFIDIPAAGWPLPVSHALLSRCQLYVGNDSSGLHLAVLCGRPAIGLFCVTPPFTYSPLFVAVEPDPPGTGLDGIGVDAVFDAAVRSLAALSETADPATRHGQALSA